MTDLFFQRYLVYFYNMKTHTTPRQLHVLYMNPYSSPLALGLLIAAFVFNSCASLKKAPPLPVEPEISLEEEFVELDSLTFETFAFDLYDTISPIFLMASIERKPCFGQCPVYKAEFYNNGVVLYEGLQHAKRLGKYKSRIGKKEVEAIKNFAERVNYYRLADYYPTYGATIDDLPTTITYMSVVYKSQQITNVHHSPAKLHKFERFLDEILERQSWQQAQ